MNKIAILYGSTTGNTEAVAKKISSLLNADLFNVADGPAEIHEKYDILILGASTWGFGDLQDDWEEFLPTLESANLQGKIIAIFGLGDADNYPDSFVDGIGTIYNAIEGKGCKIVGFTPVSEFSFEKSTAVIGDQFVGLPLDEDNESSLSEGRIRNWIEQLKKEFN